MARETKQAVKTELIRVAKLMEAEGMGNSYEGNLSIKDDGLVYITPSGKRKASLTEDMIAVIDENGVQIDGCCKPSSELSMHIEAYNARPDAGAVIHAHAPHLMAFAMCRKPIDFHCSHELLCIFKEIPVAKYGRAGTDQIVADAKELLKKRDMVLLANHGSLQVAKDLETALARLEAAEGMARVFILASSIGTPVDIPDEEVEYWYNKIL